LIGVNVTAKVDRKRNSFMWARAAIGLLVAISSATTANGESTFREHCGKCHARPTSVLRGLKGNAEQERRRELDEFLAMHHAEDPELRAEIIDYLMRLLAQ
jgi:hypothetical protein